MTRSELTDLVARLARELTRLGHAYARDPAYILLLAKTEARRKLIAAKNSSAYYDLSGRLRAAENALTMLDIKLNKP